MYRELLESWILLFSITVNFSLYDGYSKAQQLWQSFLLFHNGCQCSLESHHESVDVLFLSPNRTFWSWGNSLPKKPTNSSNSDFVPKKGTRADFSMQYCVRGAKILDSAIFSKQYFVFEIVRFFGFDNEHSQWIDLSPCEASEKLNYVEYKIDSVALFHFFLSKSDLKAIHIR